MPGIGSNHETKGDRDWKNAIFKIQKIKGWKALKKKTNLWGFLWSVELWRVERAANIISFPLQLLPGEGLSLPVGSRAGLYSAPDSWQTCVWSQVWSWAQLALIWGAFHHLKMTSPHSPDFSILDSRHFSKLQATIYWPFFFFFFFYYSAVWGFLVCLITALGRRVVNVSIGLTKRFVQVWKNSNEHFGQPNTKGENQKNTTFLFLPFWLFFLGLLWGLLCL